MGLTTPESKKVEQVEQTERDRKLSLIEKVDKAHDSPALRAQKVLNVLRSDENVNTWDVLCFCAEYIGMMSSAWPWLESDAKRFARLIYTAHYEHFGTTLGPEEQMTLKETL